MIEVLKCEKCGCYYGPDYDGLVCPKRGCNGKLKLVTILESGKRAGEVRDGK